MNRYHVHVHRTYAHVQCAGHVMYGTVYTCTVDIHERYMNTVRVPNLTMFYDSLDKKITGSLYFALIEDRCCHVSVYFSNGNH